jgi:hypothetical protein
MKKNSLPQSFHIIPFTILGLVALQVPLTAMLGANTKFTLYDLFAPALGGIVGVVPAILTILLTQMLNVIIHGAAIPNMAGIIRIFPSLFATVYFAKNRRMNVIVPFLAILAFNLHPIGHSAWIYSMFWLIPIVMNYFRNNIFLRSMGATFAAHAVGGALWVWTFGLTKQMWLALIPQTILERTIFAAGITASSIVLSYLIRMVGDKKFTFLQKTFLPQN